MTDDDDEKRHRPPAKIECFTCADTGVMQRIPLGNRRHARYQLIPCSCTKGRVLAATDREMHTVEPNVRNQTLVIGKQ